jgi:amidohydrolase
VRGRGGHGALPHQTVDPIVATAQIVTALQSIVSRNVSPQETAVVTVGTVHGGDAFNIIPTQVDLSGTIRTYSPQVREMVLRRVREVVEGVATACGAEADLDIIPLTPAVINDAEVAEVVRLAAEAVVGAENVSSDVRTMGSEDAAYFMQEVPGCYFFLGSANAERELNAPHHNPRFDFDEDVLPLGVAVMMQTLAHYLHL